MSLLKWKELAKRKTELGNKINYVHNAITQHKIGQETSQESFGKLFKPVTSKLDDVIDSNLNLRMPPQRRKQPPKKAGPEIDYAPEVDPYEDMDVEGLINFGDYVPPQQEKQIIPKLPTYKESSADLVEGNEDIYFDTEGPPPEYDDDEGVNYEIDDEDKLKELFKDMGVNYYDDVDYKLNQPEMTPKNKKTFINKIIKESKTKWFKLRSSKSESTKKMKENIISEAEKNEIHTRANQAMAALKDYMNYYEAKKKEIGGSGIKGRRRKNRGGNVIFFNDPKQLLKKLEWIVGELIAGNTNIQMRNMGVNILDTLLRMSTINKAQYNKLYNQHFKVKFM